MRSSERPTVEKDIEMVFLEHGFKKPKIQPRRVEVEQHFMQRNYRLRTSPQTELSKIRTEKRKPAQNGDESAERKKDWNQQWELHSSDEEATSF